MKKLIVCCDGTWNRADQAKNGAACPTNVVRLAYRVANRDPAGTPQILYYGQGVGTGNALDRFTGGAFGGGLEANIFEAYRFLVANFEVGDELFLFGFSRGAYTARSLGGMIRKCGILKRPSIAQYAAALALYREPDSHPDDAGPRAFREQHSLAGLAGIPIKFIGVWDTVGSLGVPVRGLRWLTRSKHEFHDTELSGSVAFAYHALALDERRAPFVPTLWLDKPKPGQVVEQTWFCGVHSDVGGGYPERDLSDISLAWMIERAAAPEVGLAFDAATSDALALAPDPLGALHRSKKGLYVVTPGVDREPVLDGSDRTQSLHASVRVRWDGAAPPYRPRSLPALP